jgi:hypothetical protein
VAPIGATVNLGGSAYGPAKGGILSYTRHVAVELGPDIRLVENSSSTAATSSEAESPPTMYRDVSGHCSLLRTYLPQSFSYCAWKPVTRA